MDLQQRKLNKSEWNTTEVPVSQDEIEVLKLIIQGYHNVSIKYNKAESLYSFLKIDVTSEMEDHLYNKYFSEKIKNIIKSYKANFISINVNSKPQIKKADLIRLEKNTLAVVEQANIYENILLENLEKIIKYKQKNSEKWELHYYTLFKLLKNNVTNINNHIKTICKIVIDKYNDDIDITNIIKNAVTCIEKNETLLKYGDITLYDHQKKLFTHVKEKGPKLILYIAPTGTGKTLSPIGLSEGNRVIFVCAARHVGLALARAAISVNKKIAFAYGCASADDIRLHYFAAKEVTKNYKTGGIWKVDNSVGDKVEIIICDIKSYLPAMYYMMAFNDASKIITYWDEPTITFDYDEHDFHDIIQKNWQENKIPNMVLSSATLPKVHEIQETISDFTNKFSDTNIYSIISHDCKKSIPIVNNNGYIVLPHYLSNNYQDILKITEHCENYLTLMRYFDLGEVVKFIVYINNNNDKKWIPNNMKIERNITSLYELDMINIKLYYLKLLKNIVEPEVNWPFIYSYFQNNRLQKITSNDGIDIKGNKIRKVSSIGPGVTTIQNDNGLSGKPITRLISEQYTSTQSTTPVLQNGNCAVYVTTKDAYTLTDGPTIFLATDVEKIAKFCIQQANIPAQMMKDIVEKIEYNNVINNKINKLEKDLDDLNENNGLNVKKTDDGSKVKHNNKINRQLNNDDNDNSYSDIKKLRNEIENLRMMIKVATLNETFIPNSSMHIRKWAEDINVKTAFTSDISDETIMEIMMLKDVEDSWKVLLLMGIGVFTNHESIAYTEIMKNLADQQKLYMIIASSDYIYGTNYQFCHGYLSKDLNLTQEKIIQALGRIGRNKWQQDYTIRLRDDEQINKLFTAEADKPEVRNMNRLFNSK